MLTVKGYEGSFRGDGGGAHMSVYLLKNHQVRLKFVQITWDKLYLYMKKNNEIFRDLQK